MSSSMDNYYDVFIASIDRPQSLQSRLFIYFFQTHSIKTFSIIRLQRTHPHTFYTFNRSSIEILSRVKYYFVSLDIPNHVNTIDTQIYFQCQDSIKIITVINLSTSLLRKDILTAFRNCYFIATNCSFNLSHSPYNRRYCNSTTNGDVIRLRKINPFKWHVIKLSR